MGTTIWSPLASGFLTGKYNDGIPEGSRLTQKGYEWLIDILESRKEKGLVETMKKLADFAGANLDCGLAQLALAWCVKNPNVSTVLLGATKPQQLEENLKCLPVVGRLTPEHMAEIDKILGNKPKGYFGYGGKGMRELATI